MYKLIVIIFLYWISFGWATNYYVDKNASGGNNGTSWTNAWESLAAIVWDSLGAKDTLFLSGGADSTMYGHWSIGDANDFSYYASGDETGLLVIRAGIDAGHNGRVIFDGGGGSYPVGLIGVTNQKYLRFEKLEIRNIYGHGVVLAGRFVENALNVVYLDSCIITDFSRHGVAGGGWPDNYADSMFIRFNTITGQDSALQENDGIQIHSYQSLFIQGNYITIKSKNIVEHNDCIQFGWSEIAGSGHTSVWNNICINTNAGLVAPTPDQGMISQMLNGVIRVWNNVFYLPNAQNYMNTVLLWNYTDSTFFYHNVVIGGTNFNNCSIASSMVDYAFIKNNIFYSSRTSAANQFASNITAGNIDHNLYYYTSGNTYVAGYGGQKTLAQMQAVGADLNSIVGNPDFVNIASDWNLQAGSPGENAGVLLEAPYNLDIEGNVRSDPPEIGAYEMMQRHDITPPEVTGATLLDSVTLKIMFSESLDQTTAEDENNYSISNNIDIFNATLSGSEVTLQTATHSPGSYIVTVINVEDLAGNPIAQSNTAEYSLIPSDSLIFLPIEDVQGVIQEPGHTPLKTIDGLGALSGDPDSRWAAEPMPEELIFDLGTSRTICKTKLSFYNWTGGRFYTYSILTSSDNNNWVTIVSQATSALQEEWTVDEFPAVDARYVKVLFINNNQSDWAGLWEGEIWGIISTLVDPVNNGLPNEFSLYQNYPNPFNPSTSIRFSIPKDQSVKISIYNVLGELSAELTNQEYDAGTYTIDFDGSALASGFYFYRIETPEFIETKKMILMK